MSKKILIDSVFKNEGRAVLLDKQNNIEEFVYDTAHKLQNKGNIYLAKIARIEPSLQAAFIDYGGDKNGFLPFSEIHPDYFNIPASDRAQLGDSYNVVQRYNDDGSIELEPLTPPNILDEDDNNSSGFDIEDGINNEKIDEEAKIDNAIKLDADEDEVDALEQGNNNAPHFNYKIQEVLKRGQVILVQASKEERGNKGAAFTSYISLAGRCTVLMPNKSRQNGISRRISNIDERKRLRNIVSQLNNQNSHSSVIIRTAGIGRSMAEIKRDYDYLVRLWNKIREVTLTATAPALVHSEEDLLLKVIRDLCNHKVSEVIVQGAGYKKVMNIANSIMPDDINKVKEYNQKSPIFCKYNIETQISQLYTPRANLPSGGYVIINPTEALISIDVNSGKATSERSIEDTALKTNLEAAKEIARQLKLRDASGLIVIDFIDMNDVNHRRSVERYLRRCLSLDKARIQVGNISNFGLLEMSRQRMRPSFLEANSDICDHCNGKGIVRAAESNALVILRTVENEICRGSYSQVNIYAAVDTIMYIVNHKKQIIDEIEQKYQLKLGLVVDSKANADSFAVEKIKESNNVANDSDAPAVSLINDVYNDDLSLKSDQQDKQTHTEKADNKTTNKAENKKKKWRADNKTANNANKASNSDTESAKIENGETVANNKAQDSNSKPSAKNKKKVRNKKPVSADSKVEDNNVKHAEDAQKSENKTEQSKASAHNKDKVNQAKDTVKNNDQDSKKQSADSQVAQAEQISANEVKQSQHAAKPTDNTDIKSEDDISKELANSISSIFDDSQESKAPINAKPKKRISKNRKASAIKRNANKFSRKVEDTKSENLEAADK